MGFPCKRYIPLSSAQCSFPLNATYLFPLSRSVKTCNPVMFSIYLGYMACNPVMFPIYLGNSGMQSSNVSHLPGLHWHVIQ